MPLVVTFLGVLLQGDWSLPALAPERTVAVEISFNDRPIARERRGQRFRYFASWPLKLQIAATTDEGLSLYLRVRDRFGAPLGEPAEGEGESSCFAELDLAAGTFVEIEAGVLALDQLGRFRLEVAETPGAEEHFAAKELVVPDAPSTEARAAIDASRDLLAQARAAGPAADPEAVRALLVQAFERLQSIEGAEAHPDGARLAVDVADAASEAGDTAIPLRAATAGRDQLARCMRDDDLALLRARFVHAALLSDGGNHVAARQELERCLAMVERFHPGDEELLHLLRRGLGLTLVRLGEGASACPLLEQALAALERTAPPDDLRSAIVRQSLAFAQFRSLDFAAARRTYERVLAVQERKLPPGHPDLLWTKSGLGCTLVQIGDAAAARPLLEPVLAERERTRPEGHPDLLWARLHFASCVRALGDLARARDLQLAVVAQWERTLPSDHFDLAYARAELAATLSELGDRKEALHLRERVLLAHDRTLQDSHPALVQARAELAVSFWEMGRFEDARRLQESVLESRLASLPPDHVRVRETRTNLGLTLLALGEPLAARDLLEAALDTAERTLPPDSLGVVTSRMNLELVLRKLGDLDAARLLLDDCIRRLESMLPEDHPTLLNARQNLASCLCELGESAAALPLLRSVLAARLRTFPEEHPFVLGATGMLAMVLEHLGQMEESLDLLRRLRAIVGREVGPDHPELLHLDLNVSAVLLAAARFDEAHVLTREVLARLGPTAPPNTREYAVRRHAWTLLALGDGAGLAALGPRLIDPPLRVARLAGLLGPREASELIGTTTRRLNEILSFAGAAGADEVTHAAPFELVEALRDAASGLPHHLLTPADAAAVHALRERALAARRRLHDLVTGLDAVAGGGTVHASRIAEASRERDRAEREVQTLLEERAVPVVEVTTAALAAALPEGHAAAGFRRYRRLSIHPEQRPTWIGVDWYLAHVLRRDGTVARVDIGPADAVDESIRAWRDAVGKPLERGAVALAGGADVPRVQGERLRAVVLDPVLAASNGATTLHVCLDDALHLVPLDALPSGEGCVGDHVQIQVERSFARLLVPLPAGARDDPGLLAFGGIDFDAAVAGALEAAPVAAAASPASRLRAGPYGMAFHALRQTKYEVEALGDLFERSFGRKGAVLLEGEATKDAFVRLAPQAAFVHLATHGYFAEPLAQAGRPQGGAIESPSTLSVGETVSGLAPLTLCGVALAGANRGRDALGRVGGVLTAEELAGLDLSGCELAVLSACDTNVGIRRAGLGIQSLQAALHAAGARTAVTSLWKVDDEATRALMLDFYRRLWVEKTPKAEALWQAKRALRARGAPLRDWAGWLLTGDPD